MTTILCQPEYFSLAYLSIASGEMLMLALEFRIPFIAPFLICSALSVTIYCLAVWLMSRLR